MNKPKILVLDLNPYYRLEVHPDGTVNCFSNSPVKKGAAMEKNYTQDGYLRFKVGKNSTYAHAAHIIAEKCIGPRPKGLVINHIDGNKLNNHPSNLEYVTIAENIKHAIRMGLHVASDPTRMPTYKDGRTFNKKAYKLAWYHANKNKSKEKSHDK